MSELTFEQMLDASLKTIHAGEVVEGTVIDVKPEEAVLNIGCKSDGILTRNEYSNDSNLDLTTVVKPGDTMEVKVLKVNDGEGQVLLTYKRLAADRGNKRIEEAFNNHEVLKAKVTQVLDGGLIVVVDEVRIFIPASLVSDTYEKDLTKYADQEIEFVISEYNPKRRRYIGDRKQLIVAKKAEMQKELLERIRDIRASEKVFYRQVLEIYATSIDYDPKAEISIRFFKKVQNKIHYAIHGQTAAEVIYTRADAEKEFMGLTTFAGNQPTLKEAIVAKNYLNEKELRAMGQLVSGYLDFAERQAEREQAMTMQDWAEHLDRILTMSGEQLLIGNGSITHKQAVDKATGEYRKYKTRTLSDVENDYLNSIKMLEQKTDGKK